MADWYYHLPGEGRIGPLDAEDVREAYRDGRVQRDTLAWHVGARDWQPLDRFSEALRLDEVAAPARSPSDFALADVGPAALTPAAAAGDTVERVSPYAPPRATLTESADYLADAGEVVYAGFWKRAAALVIDTLVVSVAYVVAFMVFAFVAGALGLFSGGSAPSVTAGLIGVLAYLGWPIVSGLYYVAMESSSTQATLGKMAIGIKVTDAEGRRIGGLRALGRWASHLLCYLTIYIGYAMAAFTREKRALHDLVAGTLVVDRWAYTAYPQRQRHGLGAVAIVVLILGLGAALAYLGVVAAVALPAYQEYVRRAAGGG